MADMMHCFTCGGKTSGVEGYRPVPSKTAHPAAPKDGPCTCPIPIAMVPPRPMSSS